MNKKNIDWCEGMGKTKTRFERLSALLAQKGRMELGEIQQLFEVSESTARRMCKAAEEEGLAVRTYGGGLQTIAQPVSEMEYSFERKAIEHTEEKERIGAYASSKVENGDIIFVSGGTTAECFVRSLTSRIARKELSGVVIMTNSICNAEVLGEHNEVILTGGVYRPQRRDVAGYASEATIRGAHFNKSFIGVDGIELTDGLMALDNDTGNMDRLVTSRSDLVYILADSSKFRTKSFISYEHFLPKHIIVTDSGLDSVALMRAKERGIAVVCCGKEMGF